MPSKKDNPMTLSLINPDLLDREDDTPKQEISPEEWFDFVGTFADIIDTNVVYHGIDPLATFDEYATATSCLSSTFAQRVRIVEAFKTESRIPRDSERLMAFNIKTVFSKTNSYADITKILVARQDNEEFYAYVDLVWHEFGSLKIRQTLSKDWGFFEIEVDENTTWIVTPQSKEDNLLENRLYSLTTYYHKKRGSFVDRSHDSFEGKDCSFNRTSATGQPLPCKLYRDSYEEHILDNVCVDFDTQI
jgi:hypothetical protein